MNPQTLTPAAHARVSRRTLAREVRDAFPPMGIYAIRARASGCSRVAASRNVHAALNRARFELRMGKYADRSLQAAFNERADDLTFEILELVRERQEADFDYAAELAALEQMYRDLQAPAP